MNEPDQDRLALMERYGHALMKPADIAILLDIPADQALLQHSLSPTSI